MAFHDVQFPTDISYGSSGGPTYSTDVVITVGGYEQRNANWSQARARYNVAYGVKSQQQLQQLVAFLRARKGRAHAFRFKDWMDYEAVGQLIGTGDAGDKSFQLTKTYSSGGVSESRTITRPIASSVAIYLNGVQQSSGWSCDDSSGIITFDSAPSSGVVITADFAFDVPVRFDTDRLSGILDDYGLRSWQDIALIEIREV